MSIDEPWRTKYPFRTSLPAGTTVRALREKHTLEGEIVIISEGGALDHVDCEIQEDAEYLRSIAYIALI